MIFGAWKKFRAQHLAYLKQESKGQSERICRTDKLEHRAEDVQKDAREQAPQQERRLEANTYSEILFGGTKKGKT